MRGAGWAAIAWVAVSATAQEAHLADLHATLAKLRSHAVEANVEMPTAGQDLTVAKHQLRDWIETKLGSLQDFDRAKAFTVRINDALKTAGPVDGQNLLGTLGEVRVSHELGILTLTTAVGVLCQYDESAYGYRSVNGRWQRIWESEQDDYSPKRYAPQSIMAVHVWQAYKNGREKGPTFVMTLGNSWGCASSWHPIYYRVWRVGASGLRTSDRRFRECVAPDGDLCNG